MLVTGWQQVITVLVAVVPGFVHQGVRAWFRGPSPEDGVLGVRLIRALAFSGLIGLVYLAVFGTLFRDFGRRPLDELSFSQVFFAVSLILVLVFVIPAGIALVSHAASASRDSPTTDFRYDPTPSAWDFAVRRIEPGAVRILTNGGIWIGGLAAKRSFFTSYPDPREILLEQAWELADDGTFERPLAGSAGMWVQCDDVQIVQFFTDTVVTESGRRRRVRNEA